MNLKEKSVSGLFWQFISMSVQAMANIAYLMIMARLVSKEAFGVFAVASVFISYIAMFSEFGLGAGIIQKKELSEKDISFTFYTNLFLSIFLFIIFIGLSPLVSAFYNHSFTALFFIILSCKLIIKALSTVSNALLIREMEFRKLFIANASSFILGNLGVGVFLALQGFEEWSLLWALLSVSFLASLFLYLLKPHSFRFIHRFKDGIYIFKYGYHLTAVRFLNQTASQSDKLIIGKLFPISVLGIYERYQKVLMLPQTYIGRLSDGVLFSSMAKVQHESKHLQTIFCGFLGIVSMFMLMVSIYCFLFPEQIIEILLGKKWIEDALLFRLYAIVIFLQTFSRYTDTLVRATNALRQSVKIKFFYMVSMISLILLAAPSGIVYVIGGIIIAKFIHAVLMFFLSKHIMKISWPSYLKQFKGFFILFVTIIFKFLMLDLMISDLNLLLILSIILDIVLINGIFKWRRRWFTPMQCELIDGALKIITRKIRNQNASQGPSD